MSGLPSVVDTGLEHDDGTLGVCGSEGEPIGFGERTCANEAARIGQGVSENKLSKKLWPEWCRWLRSRKSSAVVPSRIHFQGSASESQILSVRPEQELSVLPKPPDQGTGSNCQRRSSRSTVDGKYRRAEKRSSALSCSHTLHREKAASS